MISFEIVDDVINDKGTVQFSKEDKGFDYVPNCSVDINIAIAYLNIGIDSETMYAKYVWGFSPMESWERCTLVRPKFIKSGLKLLGNYQAGLTWRLDKDRMWKSYYDEESGWYCIGSPKVLKDNQCVEFAEKSIAVLCGNELKAIWLYPEFK